MDSFFCYKAESPEFTPGEEPSQYAQTDARSERNFTGYMMADEIVARLLNNPYDGYEKESNNHETTQLIEPTMTPALFNSMINGNLSPEALSNKDIVEIIKLNQKIERYCLKPGIGIMELEYAIIDVYEKNQWANVSDDYEHDHKVYAEALERKEKALEYKGNNHRYTCVTWVQLNGLFNDIPCQSPLEKLIHSTVKVVNSRARKYYLHLVPAAQDDQLIRKDVIETLNTIIVLCTKTNDLFILQSLTMLYFSLYHTFKKILEDDDDIVREFKDFIYLWDHKYPDEEVVRRYNESVNSQTTIHTNYANQQHDVPQDIFHPEQQMLKEKSLKERCKEAAKEIGFFELKQVKALTSGKQIDKLWECLLERSEDYGERLCYVAAWLEYLGAEKLFRNSKRNNKHPVEDYIKWCEKYIMGMEKVTGTCFKRYRAKAKEYKYRQQVEIEYQEIFNNIV